jgi:hypothetical protein
MPADLMSLGSATLIELLQTKASEKAMLTYTDAPDEELRNCQYEIERLEQEILRRMSW